MDRTPYQVLRYEFKLAKQVYTVTFISQLSCSERDSGLRSPDPHRGPSLGPGWQDSNFLYQLHAFIVPNAIFYNKPQLWFQSLI